MPFDGHGDKALSHAWWLYLDDTVAPIFEKKSTFLKKNT